MNKRDKSRPDSVQLYILEASAGSGKTYALAKHFIKLLMSGEGEQTGQPLRSILAITFTVKASLEMKSRVFEMLKKIALESFSSPSEKKDILTDIGIPEEEARKRSFALIDQIIRNYGYFRIQTIDSFMNEIISGSSLRLGLSSKFGIKTDYAEYIARGLDMLIEDSVTDGSVKSVIMKFLEQYLHLEQKTGWLPQRDMFYVINDLYGKANTYGADFSEPVGYSSKDILEMKKAAYRTMKDLFGVLPEGTNKTFRNKLLKIISERGEKFQIGDLGRYFSREALPVNKGGDAGGKAGKLWAGIIREIKDIASAEALSFFNCYIDLYELAAGHFETLARKDDILFLGELNRKASAVLSVGGAVPELYYRMSVRFRHFLVDEFQDTSLIQWKNMMPMAEEILSNGGSLFYVGDKKQAIYRFRGGDAALFDRVPDNFPQAAREVGVLDRNFRSRKELIDFNNQIFSRQNVARFIGEIKAENEEKALNPAAVSEILGIYSRSGQEQGRQNPGGYVSVKSIEAKNNDERDAAMQKEFITLMRALRDRYSFGEIAVLARQNDEVELFTSWLLEDNMPAESEKTLDLRANPVIKEILSFMMFLDSPVNDAAFASFITGHIFEALSGFEVGQMHRFIFKKSMAGEKRYLYVVFRENYPELWNAYFEDFFVNVGFMPVYELTVSLISKFRVSANFGRYQGFIAHLLQLIYKNEAEHRSLRAFLEYLDTAPEKDMYVMCSGADSVKLMTIHKAKGLEFPVVIIPYLSMDLTPNESGSASGICHLDTGSNKLSLIKLNKEYALYSPELSKLYDENLKKSFIDELNTVYVALTRAKDELHIFIPERSGNARNPARIFITDRGVRGKTAEGKQRLVDEPKILPGESCGDWIKILKNEFPGGRKAISEKAALAGEVVHYALSYIGNMEDTAVGEAVSAAVGEVIKRYPGIEKIEALRQTLANLLTAPALKDIFCVQNGIVRNELELTDKNGEVKRVDRLIEKKDVITVIDYKSSRQGMEAHIEQLSYYKHILKDVYPSKKIEGTLVYLDSRTLEKV